MSVGSLIAVLIVLVALLGALGVVPFTPLVVFLLILGLAAALVLGLAWPDHAWPRRP
jgi:hypothetical protein